MVERHGREVARKVFGYAARGEAWASRIHVSHLYRETPSERYRLKVWGDPPEMQDVRGVIDGHVRERFDGAHADAGGN